MHTATRVALQIQDRSQKSRPVSSLNQSQTQMTRPVATGLALQRGLGVPQNLEHFVWEAHISTYKSANNAGCYLHLQSISALYVYYPTQSPLFDSGPDSLSDQDQT